LESSKVKIGPNVRYYGNKRDMHLLTTTSTPKSMPQANLRRTLMAQILKSTARQAKSLGLLGLAGALAVKGLRDDEGKTE